MFLRASFASTKEGDRSFQYFVVYILTKREALEHSFESKSQKEHLLKTEIQSAQDASIQIGTAPGNPPLTSSSNTFNNLVPGYDITVEGISSNPVDVSIANDPDATKQKVQDLVDSYNSVLQTIGQYTATGNENERRNEYVGAFAESNIGL